MSKHVLTLGLLVLVAAVASQPAQVLSQQKSPGVPSGGKAARKLIFDSDQALATWTTTGDVTIDRTKGRDSAAGALKVGPGGQGPAETPGQGRVGPGRILGLRRRHHPRKPEGQPSRPALGPGSERWQAAGRGNPLRELSGRRRRLHRYRLRRPRIGSTSYSGWVSTAPRPAGTSGRSIFDTEKGIQILHSDENGKPTRQPQFDNTKPACEVLAPSPSGATVARAKDRPFGLMRSP